MKTIWSTDVDNIFAEGYSLTSMGVNNWALSKESALKVLNKLEQLQVAVLGGDVCELIGDIIQYNYDSWHCDQGQGELNNEFVLRSIATAKQYIKDYKVENSKRVLFAFVPKV